MSQKEQASQCFMCTQHKPYGCLECRTHRLLSDIRSGLYEKMGADQNRAEWEERALKAEAALLTAQRDLLNSKEIVAMREVLGNANLVYHGAATKTELWECWVDDLAAKVMKALNEFDALKERMGKDHKESGERTIQR